MKKHISLSLLLSVALTGFAWADNAIETLPSGVKVEHLKPGAGASPRFEMFDLHTRGQCFNGVIGPSKSRQGNRQQQAE